MLIKIHKKCYCYVKVESKKIAIKVIFCYFLLAKREVILYNEMYILTDLLCCIYKSMGE